jgi:hypothetical protein
MHEDNTDEDGRLNPKRPPPETSPPRNGRCRARVVRNGDRSLVAHQVLALTDITNTVTSSRDSRDRTSVSGKMSPPILVLSPPPSSKAPRSTPTPAVIFFTATGRQNKSKVAYLV